MSSLFAKRLCNSARQPSHHRPQSRIVQPAGRRSKFHHWLLQSGRETGSAAPNQERDETKPRRIGFKPHFRELICEPTICSSCFMQSSKAFERAHSRWNSPEVNVCSASILSSACGSSLSLLVPECELAGLKHMHLDKQDRPFLVAAMITTVSRMDIPSRICRPT